MEYKSQKYYYEFYYISVHNNRNLIQIEIQNHYVSLDNEELLITLKGELNTTTAPELEKVIDADLKGVTTLIFEFADLRYLSSAGLRVLLVAQKIMNKQGKMIVRHPNEDVMDVFDITGFANVLTIEN